MSDRDTRVILQEPDGRGYWPTIAMTRPRIETFTVSHLEMADFDVRGFPVSFWEGKALTALVGNRVLAICGASRDGDGVKVGMLVSPEMAEHGHFLTRAALRGIKGLKQLGIKHIRARCTHEIGRRWLLRLGFVADGEWFVK